MSRFRPYLNDSRGMTLIEVLICVLILGIVTALVMPTATSAMHKFKLRDAAKQLQADIRWLQNEAITKRKQPYISFYVEGKSTPPNIYVLKQDYSTTIRRVDLPKGIRLIGSTFNPRLEFSSQGSTRYGGGTLTLTNENDDLLYVIVAVGTGRVRIDTKPPLNWIE